jgi:GntR family transcriptional repressor for pyruvate dehydrogenase complex
MADPFADRRSRRPRDRSGHALPITPGDAVVRPLKTSESVARDIVHDIVTRGLQTGDRLPSEAAMLAEYGVSRESLREGLRLLEVQGLITLRRGPGGGPVVGYLDPANLGRTSTLYYHLAGGTYNELTEAWMLTESLLAHRAARHPDRDAVRKAMEPFTSEIDPHGDQPVPGFVAEHTHFHHVVAEFAQNKVLEVMLQTIGLIVTHHIVVVGDPRDVRDTIAADHAEVARAVAAGHATKARRAMERHVGHLSDYYREQFGAQMDEFIDWR